MVDWVLEGQERGAGEILITSVDRDGTREGPDVQLFQSAARDSRVPIIAGGGIGTPEHCADVIVKGGVDAVAIATALHYETCHLMDIRSHCERENIVIRRI